MNVSGLNNSLRDLLASRLDPAAGRPVEQQPQPAGQPRALSLVAPGKSPSPADAALGTATAAPEGTDPALWSVLTSDERAFFAKHVTTGPLTYSKMMLVKHPSSSAAPSIRGGRVDIRA